MKYLYDIELTQQPKTLSSTYFFRTLKPTTMKIVKTKIAKIIFGLLLFIVVLASCEKDEMVNVVPSNTTEEVQERRNLTPAMGGPVGIGEVTIDVIKNEPRDENP